MKLHRLTIITLVSLLPTALKNMLKNARRWHWGQSTMVSSTIKLEAILAAMSDAVFIADADGQIIEMNDAFAAFHRFQSAQAAMHHVTKYIDIIEAFTVDGRPEKPNDWPIARALRGETGIDAQYSLRRKDTGETWIASYSFAPIRDAGGIVIGAVGTARDITEQKQREEQLETLSSRLHLAVSSAHLGVWDWEVATDKMFWDDRMLELYGISRESFSGRVDAWSAPLHPDDRQRAIEEVQAALRGERDFDTEFRVVHHDGKILHLKASGTVLRAADGSPKRMLGVNADITEERSAQDRLRRAYAEVEGKVFERTAELEAARVAAENASKAKDLFLATLSHELRTPLNAIISWSQLMERGLPPEKMQLAIRTIKENVWSQNQLISDLLDISRIVTGKLNIDSQPTSVAEVLRAAVETIRATAEQRGITIMENIEEGDVFILADPGRLKQALWNLLTNAVKFTSSGGVITVSLTSENHASPGKAHISIQDTGKGIKSEFLPHIFNHFSQADPSSVRVHGGMGLGLSLVRSLVKLQGGNVTAESPGEGQGSTFTVTFPLLGKSDFTLMRASNTAFSTPIEEIPDLSHLKILLVEDNDKTRIALAELLASQGARVEAAESAKRALESFDSFQPDIIVSDIAMPQEDGHSMLRKIRARGAEKRGTTPAIALTAYGEPRDRDEAFTSGFQEYLVKPVEAHTLANTILKVTNQKTSHMRAP